MSRPVEAILLGAGLRGAGAYGPYALAQPEDLCFVAVAEPDPVRRARFAAAHKIPPQRQFASWQDALARPQLADVVLNCTQDAMHLGSGQAALEAGYDMLLEKPMAPDLASTVQLVQAAERQGRLLQICHVLRYTPFFATLHQVLESGQLGDLITVEHRENVAYWHMAHSFVRGNWRDANRASPMILAKCCHDLDILYWNLDRPVRRIQSFGSLLHFRPEHAPPGATARCTDDCPAAGDCPFDARRLYLDMTKRGWPVAALAADLSWTGRWAALETGPYGRCVYRCDNNVVDHQTVTMEFSDGTTAVLFMHGHSHQEARTMRYDGTRATLRGIFTYDGTSQMEIHDHITGRCQQVPIPAAESGHGGGDFGVIRSFVRAVRNEVRPLTSARVSLESHLLAFAAEESRHTGMVVDMEAFRICAG
jgi:predicted dehydrogenase